MAMKAKMWRNETQKSSVAFSIINDTTERRGELPRARNPYMKRN